MTECFEENKFFTNNYLYYTKIDGIVIEKIVNNCTKNLQEVKTVFVEKITCDSHCDSHNIFSDEKDIYICSRNKKYRLIHKYNIEKKTKTLVFKGFSCTILNIIKGILYFSIVDKSFSKYLCIWQENQDTIFLPGCFKKVKCFDSKIYAINDDKIVTIEKNAVKCIFDNKGTINDYQIVKDKIFIFSNYYDLYCYENNTLNLVFEVEINIANSHFTDDYFFTFDCGLLHVFDLNTFRGKFYQFRDWQFSDENYFFCDEKLYLKTGTGETEMVKFEPFNKATFLVSQIPTTLQTPSYYFMNSSLFDRNLIPLIYSFVDM
jgi:hypothetical protein